uniref:Uncharacterized protein n=1 Tax=Hyaloperonospora arabidopsidis (strain Emoy2) TaxID=559515 RepID=M4BQN7_HYAAE
MWCSWSPRIRSKLWSSPFDISNPVRRAKSSYKTLTSSHSFFSDCSCCIMYVSTQYSILGQSDQPLLVSVEHLLM